MSSSVSSVTGETCPLSVAARAHPDALAILFGEERIRYAALEERVQRLTAALRRRAVVPGDRVAFRARSHPDTLALFFALPRLRAALVPLNLRWTQHEVDVAVERVRPRLILTAETLTELCAEPPRDAAVTVDRERPAALLFTSGTSGIPKVAPLTGLQLEAAVEAARVRLQSQPEGHDRWLGTLPLFHVGGLVMAYRCVKGAARLVLEAQFDAQRTWELLRTQEITHASFVATTLRRVLDAAEAQLPPRSLRAVLVGGGPVPEALSARAREAGFPVVLTYGLTETASQVCTEFPRDADGQTAGAPLPGVEVRITDADCILLPAGSVGEIEVRGSTVMTGYWEASQPALKDGWFRTGDLGRLDGQARLRIESRRTDLIVSGGENVYPAEIEAVLLAHPAIADAAVTGAPSDEWGQVPVALVVLVDGVSHSDDAPAGLVQGKSRGLQGPQAVHSLPRAAAQRGGQARPGGAEKDTRASGREG